MPTCSTPAFWQSHKERIQAGQMLDVFPYDETQRFPASEGRTALA